MLASTNKSEEAIMGKLKLENISKTYRNGSVVHALRGVSLGRR